MTRHREELDDTIDRVAAAITFVPADPALAARVAERIGDAAPGVFAWPRLTAGVVGVASVALVVAMLTNSRQESGETPLVTGPAPAEQAPALAEATPAVTPTASPVAAAKPRPAVRRATPGRPAEDAGGVPQIAALASPPLIDFAELPTDALTIAPVDLAPLDLANLPLGELDDRADPKE